MAKGKTIGNFTVVNHLDFLLGEKIAEYQSKETSGNGAGSQMISIRDVKDLAHRIMKISANPVLIDAEIIREVRQLINQNINQLECDEHKTINQKTFIRSAVAYKLLESLCARIKKGNLKVSKRWFVSKFDISHRDTLTKYLRIVENSTWSEAALEHMNKLQKDIIKLLF